MNLGDMLSVEAKTGQHNERSLPGQIESPGMPVPYLSHSIEDILKRPSCLAETEMQKNEKGISENTWTPNGKGDLKSCEYTGDLLLKLYTIIPFPSYMFVIFSFLSPFLQSLQDSKIH